jgi:hypothetical protein
MWDKTKAFVQDANMHWRDLVYIIFISMALMLLTNHITDNLCN